MRQAKACARKSLCTLFVANMIRRSSSDRCSTRRVCSRVSMLEYGASAQTTFTHPSSRLEHHHTTHHVSQPAIMQCHTIILIPAVSAFQVCTPTIAISHKPQSYSHMFYIIIIITISRFWWCGAGQTSGSELGSLRLRVLSIT
jgi:hypothetical protein